MPAIFARINLKTWKYQGILYSAVIFLFIGAQYITAFVYYPTHIGDSYFPFMNYPMYSGTREIGKEINFYRIFAVFTDGTEKEVTRQDLDHELRMFQRGPVRQISKAEPDPERIALYAEMVRKRLGKRVERFRLENHPLIYKGSRVESAPVRIVGSAAVAEKGARS